METIKAAEPLSTVFLGLILLKESYSRYTYSSLIPICGGVALSCYNNDVFDLVGFSMAMASNFCFSARSVYAKMLSALSRGTHSLDEINMFFHISIIGLLFLIPITAVFEGQRIMEMIFDNTAATRLTQESLQIHRHEVDANVTTLLFLLVMNGTMFAAYNLASYVVLRGTELVTHSVLNVFRRVFIIGFTSFYFQAPLRMMSIIGIGIATGGVLLFSYFRKFDKRICEE